MLSINNHLGFLIKVVWQEKKEFLIQILTPRQAVDVFLEIGEAVRVGLKVHLGPGGFVMATEKVGVYRKYHGPIPKDRTGKPFPKSEWPRKRAFRWAVRWFSSDGKRYSRSFKTRKEAERFAEKQQSDIRNGKADNPANIKLKDFAKEHVTLMKGQIAYNTLCVHDLTLRHLLGILGNHQLQKITAQHAEMYVRRRSEAGASPSTINKEISCLRRIFNLAADRRGYLLEGQNCFNKVAKRKISRKPLRYIFVQEFKKLLASAPRLKWRVFLSLLYSTGLRLDEACHLIWADIDFEQGILRVSAKRDSKSLVPWEPKDHEIRHIPLCQEMTDLLVQWHAEAPERVPYVYLTTERYFLVMDQVTKGKWYEGKDLINNVLRDFKVIRRRAGIRHCTLHDFRRSCITNWARQLPAHVVQKLAGQSSLETTMKYYLSVQEGDLEDARYVGSNLLSQMPSSDRQIDLNRRQTDPKLTHSGKNRSKLQAHKNSDES